MQAPKSSPASCQVRHTLAAVAMGPTCPPKALTLPCLTCAEVQLASLSVGHNGVSGCGLLAIHRATTHLHSVDARHVLEMSPEADALASQAVARSPHLACLNGIDFHSAAAADPPRLALAVYGVGEASRGQEVYLSFSEDASGLDLARHSSEACNGWRGGGVGDRWRPVALPGLRLLELVFVLEASLRYGIQALSLAGVPAFRTIAKQLRLEVTHSISPVPATSVQHGSDLDCPPPCGQASE